MKDQKQLTAQEKATLIASADANLSDSVKSIRKKMIQEGYLTSFTQVSVLDRLLLGVKESENQNINQVLLTSLVMNKQVAFIRNILELFKEGWMLSRAFRFYTNGLPVKDVNAWKLRRILEVIEKKDRSDFDKIEADNKKTSGKPVSKNFKPKAKKPVVKQTTQVAGKDIPVLKK